MKKIICGILLVLFTTEFTFAQTVGTIGIGDITFSTNTDSSARSQEDIVASINSGLKDALLKTRKFKVLNYEQVTQHFKRQDLELENFYNKSNKDTEYLQAGLDYILTADISNAGLYKQKRGSNDTTIGSVDIDFRLIGVADATSDMESSVATQNISKATIETDEQSQQILDDTIAKAVDQVVDRVIARLFPIRVVQIKENGTIKLNYGRGVLKAGDTVLVYAGKDDVVFDAAGEPVGEAIATLQVIETEKRFSNAQALNGFETLEKRQIAKLLITDN